MRFSPRVPVAALVAVLALFAAAARGSDKESTEVKFKIESPKNGETLPGPDVTVTFKLENYEVYFDSTRMKGQHIHMILDNLPYVPHYSRDPYVLKNLSPGTHTLRAFPSREWHESIKDDDAFDMVTFNVGKADGQNSPNPAFPLLTYSRPKGDYVGHAADSILVDFWIKHAKLGKDNHKVRLTVDGKPELLEEWKPYWKTGLAMGPHSFRLELLDKDGKAVPGPFNVTERTINLKAAPTDTSGAHAH
jgi:hypothetical protein